MCKGHKETKKGQGTRMRKSPRHAKGKEEGDGMDMYCALMVDPALPQESLTSSAWKIPMSEPSVS